jgi:hypothetical protein
MGSALSPTAFHRQQLAQHHNTNEQTTVDLPVCHPMYVAGNQRLQELRAGHTRQEEEGFPGELALAEGGLDSSLSRRRVRRVRQLRETTFRTALGSEGPQCWSKDHVHKIITRSSICIHV